MLRRRLGFGLLSIILLFIFLHIFNNLSPLKHSVCFKYPKDAYLIIVPKGDIQHIIFFKKFVVKIYEIRYYILFNISFYNLLSNFCLTLSNDLNKTSEHLKKTADKIGLIPKQLFDSFQHITHPATFQNVSSGRTICKKSP